MNKRLLFVDDEASIRLTLPAVLRVEGFEVSVASSVPEALNAIQNQQFDILLSDLNIGQPGDGFTVVSAMRRIQPEAATFILTGYPDFESALIAIRNQVDDYLTKPADIRKLVETLKQKSAEPRRPQRSVPLKRISVIIRENRNEILQRWLARTRSNPELSQRQIPERQRIDHVSEIILEIVDRIENHTDSPSQTMIQAATKHGAARYEQGYTIPMLFVEAAILEKIIAELLEEHLLGIDISTLICDMNLMSEAMNCAVEISIRAFLQVAPETELA